MNTKNDFIDDEDEIVLPKPSEESLKLLSSLDDFDDFETKVYPVKSEEIKVKPSKFLSGKSKFIKSESYGLSPEDFLLREKEKWQKENIQGLALVDLQSVDVVKVPKEKRKKIVKSLANSITKIKDFIIDEVAPLQLALGNALEEAKQTLENSLDIKLESNHKLIETMIKDAIRLKIFNFVAQELNLTAEEKETLVNKYYVILVENQKYKDDKKSKR